MLKRLGRALTSPTAGVVLGVVLATFVYGDFNLSNFGIGMLADPPGDIETSLLDGLLWVFPGLIENFLPGYVTLYYYPILTMWIVVRVLAALLICLPVAAWCRWRFRNRSDPDALLGTILTLLPLGLAWWALMLLFQQVGVANKAYQIQGYGWVGALLTLTPAFVLVLVAALFQRFGSARPSQYWDDQAPPVWKNKLDLPDDRVIALRRVDLEPAIKAIEIDRTGLTIIGAIAGVIPTIMLLLIVLIVAFILIDLLAVGRSNADTVLYQVTGITAAALIAASVYLVGLGLLRQRRPRLFRWLVRFLLLGTIGYTVIEPFQLSAISASSVPAQALKDRLLGSASYLVPIALLVQFAWLNAELRYGNKLAHRDQTRRTPLVLVMADIANLPRLVLGLGWRNFSAQFAALFGLMLQSLLRLFIVGVLTTGVLGTLNSPLAYAKFQIGSASAACLGQVHDPFATLRRIESCPGNAEFDQAMRSLELGPSFLNPMMLFLIAIPAFLGLWLGRAALGASARRYQRVASADPRPPILYLRPFHLDRVSLKWRPRLWSTVIVPRPAEPRSIDEIILNGCIEDGPVVAYGRPGEPAPPLGAARLYVGTGDWKAMVYALADASRYIVIAVEPTDGVVWEVEQSIANGWAEKTLYLLTSARSAEEAWRMVRAITGHGPDGAPADGRLRPVAIIQRGGVWQVLFARDISRLAVEAAVQHFRTAA